MKKVFLMMVFSVGCCVAKSQKIDSIYVDLYTDSLKKGTYNYINIDAKLSNGRYVPLDSTEVSYWASAGDFDNCSLFIPSNSGEEKVLIKVFVKNNPALHKEFEIYIKKKSEEHLKSLKEVMR